MFATWAFAKVCVAEVVFTPHCILPVLTVQDINRAIVL
jgi:hypothetical protein